MSAIKNLRVFNVRSHRDADFQFVEKMNAIVGPNGSGKTTLIEALYTLLQGKSFKGSINEMASYGTQQLRAEITIQAENTEHERSLGYLCTEESSQKKWSVDGKNYARLPIGARLPLVLFEPDIARLITGGPERRRMYLDTIGGQLDFEVASAQNRFERTLKQRNKLLKQLRERGSVAADELFIWNTQLAHLSEQIIAGRMHVMQQLQDEISGHYRQLGGTDDIFFAYESTVDTEASTYASKLLQFLEASTARDIALGYTSFGPHRDDLVIRLADQPAAQRASRGEVRTIVIALKLLETELLARHYKKDRIKPTLLLDDVLSELDLIHQERVLEGFKDYQVFITTTDAHAITAGVHTIAL